MPSLRVAFILIIQIDHGFVVMIWIIPCPPSDYRWRAFLALSGHLNMAHQNQV